jgi:isopentenyl-diphosphate delta-isomerase
MDRNYVVLVDNQDNRLGIMEKLEAHQKGLLHRAFSVLIYNSKNELLIQQRALDKYHSGGLWTNATCSHPMDGESIVEAGYRRLFEEMGIHAALEVIGCFVYKADFTNGLVEHEYDYVLKGFSDAIPQINIDEVNDYRWISLIDLQNEIELSPEKFTFWFIELVNRNFLF